MCLQVDIQQIQQFVAQNLNEHRTGILGKAVSLDNMLTWTKVMYRVQTEESWLIKIE